MTIKRSTISRRRALAGVATAGVSVPVLVACGDDSSDAMAGDPTSSATSPSSKPSKKSGRKEGRATTSAPAGDGIPTSDVPVGGGIVVDSEVVVTQPSEGDFKVFSAICTHQGCPVGNVTGGTINCPCHGSQFDIETGDVVGGPASAPLDAVDFTVSGDQITLA